MSELNDLPEFYLAEGNRRVAAPTYQALMPCQIIMTSSETGLTGPTRVEAGEEFTTESVPCHQWQPLNRAAAERFTAWLDSLPSAGQGLSQEDIAEAAFAMRPREGEKEIPHEQWWPAVLKYASAMKDKRKGRLAPALRAAQNHRPGHTMPPMPFAATGPVVPIEPGRAPASGNPNEPRQPAPANAARRTTGAKPRIETPMPGTAASDSPANATG